MRHFVRRKISVHATQIEHARAYPACAADNKNSDALHEGHWIVFSWENYYYCETFPIKILAI
jgi:hypothetical protein